MGGITTQSGPNQDTGTGTSEASNIKDLFVSPTVMNPNLEHC
jgi:hypothetical protein